MLGGREADTAIAHDDGGDAVPARRGHFGIPRRLTVIMGVDVDEAGSDDLAACVDFLGASAEAFADRDDPVAVDCDIRSEAHTSEIQSLMRISYAVFCLQKKNIKTKHTTTS